MIKSNFKLKESVVLMNTNNNGMDRYAGPIFLILLATVFIVSGCLLANPTINRSAKDTINGVDRSAINQTKPQTIEQAKAVKSNDGWLVTGSVNGEKVSYQFSDSHNLATLSQSGKLVFYKYGNQVAVDKDELG